MSKMQEELGRILQQRKDAIYSQNPLPFLITHPDMLLIFKAVHGAKLTKTEQKQIRIWKAELVEYLVWHQEP